MLVLASSSAYRRALLERLRLPFEIDRPDIDECPLPGERPRDTALRLARSKAEAVAARHAGRLVIGSDQVADLAGQPLGKPGDAAAAQAQLHAMRGRTVLFHSAVCLIDADSSRVLIHEVPTTVRLRDFSDAQVLRYLEADVPYDCAGSAKIESLGIALVERVESTDPTALIGLPLIALVAMLGEMGVEVP